MLQNKALPLLLLVALIRSCPAQSTDRWEDPPRIAILFLPYGRFPWPDAVPLLVERALDCGGIFYAPAPVPENAARRIAGAANSPGGALDDRAARFLKSEARQSGIDALLIVREEDGNSTLSFTTIGAPFDSATVFRGGASGEGVLDAIPALAESAAASLRLPVTGPPTPFTRWDGESEESYALALASGSTEQFEELARRGAGHPAALLHFAARLVEGTKHRRGEALLDSIRPEALPPIERAILPAWRAVARGEPARLDSALYLLSRRFPGRFETLLLAGIAARDDRRPDDAADGFRAAATVRPFDPLPHRLMGDIALKRGFLDLATARYRTADDVGKGDVLARIGLASVAYSEGRIDDAAALLASSATDETARGTMPLPITAARANLALAGGRFADAEAILLDSRRFAYDSGDDEAADDLTARLCRTYIEGDAVEAAAYELGELRFRRLSPSFSLPPGLFPYLEGLIGIARLDLGTVSAKKLEIGVEPGAEPLLADLLDGEYLLEKGAPWEAAPYFRRVVADDDTPRSRYLLGRAYLEEGRPAKARDEFEQLVERGESLLDTPPVIPLAFYGLGRSLEAIGDVDLARAAYGEFLHYQENTDRVTPEWRHAAKMVRRW